ncbi:putative permease [Metabacillus crassostreae]|uniref:AEC family transporter n=1 Tax=Metabacillus crassostreae TaxID=929098 RepID=UPI00195EAFB9|nr:AEC family transporter [Metabacillus crassostreae]MBM7602392.1 putative permease [Metabacillus crassostreae]
MNFILIVLPAFIIFAVGYIGQKIIGFDRKSISVSALYLMYPFLAFRTFYSNELTLDYFYIFIFCLLLCFLLIIIVFIYIKIVRDDLSKGAAFILSGVFMNSGNYGVPVILFAFGEVGFDYAVIMMVIQSFLMNTIGLYYAGRGSSTKRSIKDSLMTIVKMPIIYGSLAGLFFQLTSIPIPEFIMQAADLIADATIPTIMLVLGMQLATITKRKVRLKDISFIIMMRVIISPVIAYLLITLLSIDGMLAQVLIILSAMPTAANTTMYAVQFDTEPDLVSYSTLITTLLSIVTVPIMLMLFL